MSHPSDHHPRGNLVAVFTLLLFSVCTVMAQLDFSQRIKLTDPLNSIQSSGAVDMDGDGDIDLYATTDSGLQFNWWENDGNGNFTRHRWRPEKVILQAIIGIADWNGDGRQDLWIEDKGDGISTPSNIRYLIAPGTTGGSFSASVTIIVTPYQESSTGKQIVADINGDGRHDIIDSLKVFLQNANGTFSPPVPLPSPSSQSAWGETKYATLHDYDRDGDLDIFGFDYNETLRLFKNQGSGTFASATNLLSVSTGEYFSDFTFVKHHISGNPPLLVTLTSDINGGSKLTGYEQGQDGNLLQLSELILPATTEGDTLHWGSLHRDAYSSRTFGCRVDNSSVTSTTLFEIRSTSTGFVIEVLSKHENITPLGFTSVQDLNLDGISDLIVPVPQEEGTGGTASDHIVWFEGKPNGDFSATERVVIPPFYTNYLHHMGDLDGDGDNDLLFRKGLLLGSTHDEQGFSVWSNNGSGQNYVKRDVNFNGHWASVIAVEDFVSLPPRDGAPPPIVPFPLLPGRKDLIFSTSHWNDHTFTYLNKIQIAFQDSSGNFTVRVIESLGHNGEVFYEDLDRDGMKDLVFLESNGDIMWSRRILNSFDRKALIMNLSVDYLGFKIIDMDMDGDLDFFAQGNLFGPSSSYWVERAADGEILAIKKLPKGLHGLSYDADGDGYEDFVNAHNKIVLLRNNVTFETTNRSALYPNFIHFDLDDDGDLDEIISAPTYGTTGYQRIFWRENLGDSNNPNFVPEVLVDGVEFGYRNQFAVGDMDGDGQKDLVVSSGNALVEMFRITRKTGPTVFRQWMSGQGMSGSSAGPLADWDGDSVSNWEEFLFGTQAKIADLNADGRPRLDQAAGEMAFTFQRRSENPGINLLYQTQRSTRLDNWENWNPPQALPQANGAYEVVRIPVTPGEAAEFFRVKLPEIPQ